MAKGIKALEKAVAKRKDDFPVGTVVRWTAAGRYRYAAIKTEVGWYTTARPGNTFTASVLTLDGLLEVAARTETTDVEVATEWKTIG